MTSKLPVTTFIRDVLAIPTNLLPFPSALKTNTLLSAESDGSKSTSDRSIMAAAPPPPNDANCC